MIVGLYGVSLCLLMPSVLSIGGFGESGEDWLTGGWAKLLEH